MTEQDAERAAARLCGRQTLIERSRPSLSMLLYRGARLPNYRLPSWQRGYCWTPAQRAEFHRRVLRGVEIGPIVIWNRSKGGFYVIDGQQRLLSLGFALDAQSGGERRAPRVGFNLATLDWEDTEDPAHWSVVNFVRDRHRSWVHPLYELMIDQLQRYEVDITIVGGHRGCSASEALAYFRAINSGGTPIDPATLEALTQDAS